MNVFDTHRKVVKDYSNYIQSFINISDSEIERKVKKELSEGRLWPQPLLQFNPTFKKAGTIDEICDRGLLHNDSRYIFKNFSFYQHQVEALELGTTNTDFVVTSGTGSGKSLTYMATIFNHILKSSSTGGGVAVIVYPMNALINSQSNELNRYKDNFERETGQEFPIRFNQYSGQLTAELKQKIIEESPQILLTNFKMLELLLTRVQERPLRRTIFKNLRYLVFDELHSYRGRQGADVAMLIRRICAHCKQRVCCIGTSATMVSGDEQVEKKQAVAEVAGVIFGRPFNESQVIEETLTRSLDWKEERQPTRQDLHYSIIEPISTDDTEEKIRQHPLVIWLESQIALEMKNDRYFRRPPFTFQNVVELLSEQSGCSTEKCRDALISVLQWVSTVNKRITDSGSRYTILPFKLHQFFAQTGTVYTSLEQDKYRFITLTPGYYKPDEIEKPIFPNVFSRVTGHPFICVSLVGDRLLPRDFNERGAVEDGIDGYLIVGRDIWNPEEDLDLLPDTWITFRRNGKKVPKSNKRKQFPKKIYFDEFGKCSENNSLQYWGWFMQVPLLFDPTGGVVYSGRVRDRTKLTKLGSEGRSTSTTITAFSILSRLHDDGYSLRDQKLLSFTDVRQDAALQAGHFNDFNQVIRFRSGIVKALKTKPGGALDYTELGTAIFNALSLQFTEYANLTEKPKLAHIERKYENSFQNFLIFRALLDLRRSWRIVLPNLEQCGLLDIDYLYLDECVAEEEFWDDLEIFNGVDFETRREFLATVLDYFRLEFAIYSENYLHSRKLKQYEKKFREDLKSPWTLEIDENLPSPVHLRVEPLHKTSKFRNKSIGPTSLLGKYIRHTIFGWGVKEDSFKGSSYIQFIYLLMSKLVQAGYLYEQSAKAKEPRKKEVPIYRLRISMILWKNGDGETVKQDNVRRLSYRKQNLTPNLFFQKVYQRDYSKNKKLEAADHSGQISVGDRQDREDRFRADWYTDDKKGELDEDKISNNSISALFCSPTMELGVDIGGLSVVHMRNAPPNAANYVQRSGRAGRGGEGALVFTYCSGFSPHDRHYFEHQKDLVAGNVHPPRIELVNEELLVTHLHALTITEVGFPGLDMNFEKSVRPSLVQLITKDDDRLSLSPDVHEGFTFQENTSTSIIRLFSRVIEDFKDRLKIKSNTWYSEDWIGNQLQVTAKKLDEAMVRWRKLYWSARTQLSDASSQIDSGLLNTSGREYKKYKRQQDQATRQLNLLRNEQASHAEYSEFYPYRYLASEGFLPGYDFTRLPLRIFLPIGESLGEFISRPRSIALKEFGPKNVIYHNGRKFRVSQIMINNAESLLESAKISKRVGYFLYKDQINREICPFSRVNLSDYNNRETLHDLVEMSESRGEEQARITCEEEERISRGYDIQTFLHIDGGNFDSLSDAVVTTNEAYLLKLKFIPAGRVIHVNRGWRNEKSEGFSLEMTSGDWQNRESISDSSNQYEHRFVKLWTSNIADVLYIEPIQALGLEPDGVLTLQYAIKRAVEIEFQAEPNEIGVTLMGDSNYPNIMLYEAAEGSLGILSQLVGDLDAFPRVIRTAYELCRFNDEKYKAPASYDDFLSYYNQRDHHRINRNLIRNALEKLIVSQVRLKANPIFGNYEEQYEYLLQAMDPNSSTEKLFLEYLYKNGLRLPDDAQARVEGIYCQPDFYYESRIWIFCDGSPHDKEEIRARDFQQRQLIRARGDQVWSWHYREDLADKIAERPDIFKKVK